MKIKIALSLIALVFSSACTTTKTTSNTDNKTAHYANNATDQELAPPAEGPADINANPAYMPSPLLRRSAAGGL